VLADLLDPKFLLQLLVVVATVIGAVWRTSTRIQHRVSILEGEQLRLNEKIATEIERLATAVENQNGYVRKHGENIANLSGRMEITEKLIEALVKRESDREIGKGRQS
jgi:hypothetical protein